MKKPCTWLAAAIVATSAATASATVIVDGNEWQQVADFTNLSWNDVSAVCDTGTGACSGSLNAIDLTGWTWASIDDVGALFNYLSTTFNAGGEPVHPGGVATVVGAPTSTWAPAFFDIVGFVETHTTSITRSLVGSTRTEIIGASTPQAYEARVLDITLGPTPDELNTDRAIAKSGSGNDRGVWFFRAAAVGVPEPATALLLGLGAAAFGFKRARTRG